MRDTSLVGKSREVGFLHLLYRCDLRQSFSHLFARCKSLLLLWQLKPNEVSNALVKPSPQLWACPLQSNLPGSGIGIIQTSRYSLYVE
jgi:hypothetical protein